MWHHKYVCWQWWHHHVVCNITILCFCSASHATIIFSSFFLPNHYLYLFPTMHWTSSSLYHKPFLISPLFVLSVTTSTMCDTILLAFVVTMTTCPSFGSNSLHCKRAFYCVKVLKLLAMQWSSTFFPKSVGGGTTFWCLSLAVCSFKMSSLFICLL